MFEMFPCDMCTASFSRRHDLERHRRGHSGEGASYHLLRCPRMTHRYFRNVRPIKIFTRLILLCLFRHQPLTHVKDVEAVSPGVMAVAATGNCSLHARHATFSEGVQVKDVVAHPLEPAWPEYKISALVPGSSSRSRSLWKRHYGG